MYLNGQSVAALHAGYSLCRTLTLFPVLYLQAVLTLAVFPHAYLIVRMMSTARTLIFSVSPPLVTQYSSHNAGVMFVCIEHETRKSGDFPFFSPKKQLQDDTGIFFLFRHSLPILSQNVPEYA